MSSPISITRPSSSSSTSSSSASTSFTSESSLSSSHTLIYTRDALLALGTSPLSQSPPPTSLRYFPEIVRKTRRGVVEAYQALDYARTAPVRSQGGTLTHALPPKPSTSPRDVSTQLPAPVWRVNTYVPPARRAEPELQRVRVGRDSRTWHPRAWMRPGEVESRANTHGRVIQVQ